MDINNYFIGDYFRLKYHKLLVVINGYYISGYWWLFLIILGYIMTIDGYFILSYCWIF